MKERPYITIDFDGTVVDADITDSIIARYARPGWQEAERLWEEGKIGSRECLATQMALIDVPLATVMDHVDGFSVHESFPHFIHFLRSTKTPFCIVSDGFRIIIDRLLEKAGLGGIPIHANILEGGESGLVCRFPHAHGTCDSGACKCMVAMNAGGGLPFIHIGDGRSDFCIARKALHVFSKGVLTGYCRDNKIPHTAFSDFRTVEAGIRSLVLAA